MPLHVLIIGAGTGGLALAQALKKTNNPQITFAVYDRDRTRSDGLFGYRVGISPEGSRSLSACIPSELFEVFKSTTAITPSYFNMMTEQLEELLSIGGFNAESADGVAGERSVSRMTLRQVLLTGLEDHVHFDKEFVRYETSDSNIVTAIFRDGSRASGSLLVGADGTNSPVRRQYLPHAVLKDTGLWGITAKCALTEETRALLTPRVIRGVTMVQAALGNSCIIHVMEFPWDAHGQIKRDIGGNDEALLKAWPGMNFDNTKDYILLGYGAHMRHLPKNIQQMTSPELHELLLQKTERWHPNLRTLFQKADPSTSFPINIRTTQRIEPWESSRVTLVGDAIHTMTPGLGVGANTALLDARNLAEQLVSHVTENADLVSAVAAYENQMHKYAWTRVEKSLERFNADDAIYKPGLKGSFALMLTRFSLSTANNLPFLKRKIETAMKKERGEVD